MPERNKCERQRKGGKNLKSYSGEYNSHYLRSSYEYIFCKILESKNIKYDVEAITYEIDNYRYTPDFFIYNEYSELVEIVEIRGHRLDIEERIKDTALLQEQLGEAVKVSLVTEIDLKRICKEIGLNYEKLKTEWRTNPNNSVGDWSGWRNPMFNKSQKESTKKLISLKAKERCKKSPEYGYNLAKKMIDYNRSVDFDFLRGERAERIVVHCLNCGKPIQITEARANRQRYCTQRCGVIHTSKMKIGSAYQSRIERDEELKTFILNWCEDNVETVSNTPFNGISSGLAGMYKEIADKFHIVDHRTITQAFETKSRKEFLKILKAHINQ